MSSTAETGHAKNVANFQHLIAFVTSYGSTYNPTKAAIKLTSLNILNTAAQNALTDVIAKNTAYNNAVNARIQSFSNLRTLASRLVSALEATDATPEKIADAKGFSRKIQGQRAKAAPAAPIDPNTPAPKTISSSQQSYDQLIQHFAGLISILQSETTYTPNETDLKITTLTAKQTDLIAKNNTLTSAFTNISNSRIARNKTLYQPDTGLVDIAKEVKNYLKSVYGANSPQYRQVNEIPFKTSK